MDVNVEVADAVRARLGAIFDELLAVMLDLAVQPLFLFDDDRSRLVAVRDRAVAATSAWHAADPAGVAGLSAQLPDWARGRAPEESLLEVAVWGDYFAIPPSALGLPTTDSRVLTAVPTLTERLDDDGLIDVQGLDARPHGLLVAGYSLHYHQLLRRSFASNVHYSLIGEVLSTAARFPARARLAIDERRLRFEHEHEEFEERDYWYGPALTDDFLDDLTGTGETVHGDPDGGRGLFNPYAALSVRWTSDGPLKTVQIEEFAPPRDGDAPRWVLARYLHAIRDTSVRAFVHCDGAVKGYDPAAYPSAQSEFRRRDKSSRYRKVFRLDGEFPAGAWSAVTMQWFRGNPLIKEYFAGALPP